VRANNLVLEMAQVCCPAILLVGNTEDKVQADDNAQDEQNISHGGHHLE
jgi:hypothetical protein